MFNTNTSTIGAISNAATVTEEQRPGSAGKRRPSTVASRSRIHRFVAVVVAALSLGTAVGALTSAQPAAAASGDSYCFKTRTGMIVAPATTYLELYYNCRWNRVATDSTSTWNGCGSFTMRGSYQSYYSRVVLSFHDSRSGNVFHGETPLMALPGTLYANLGTGTLRCSGGPCYGA